MPKQRERSVFAWMLLFAGAIVVFITSWPLPTRQYHWSGGAQSNQYAPIDMSLDWPVFARVDESQTVVLHIKTASSRVGLPPKPVMFTARLEHYGITSVPSGEVAQPAGQDGSLEFQWELTPVFGGELFGTLWLYISSLTPDGAESKEAISAYPLTIWSYQLFGIPMVVSRILGLIMMLAAVGLLLTRLRKQI